MPEEDTPSPPTLPPIGTEITESIFETHPESWWGGLRSEIQRSYRFVIVNAVTRQLVIGVGVTYISSAIGKVKADEKLFLIGVPRHRLLKRLQWVGFDWIIYDEPVTQVDYLDGYKYRDQGGDPRWQKGLYEHICEFAHELSILPAHTLPHLDHTVLRPSPLHAHDDDSTKRWKLTWDYARAVIGFVFNELEVWGGLPPHEQYWRDRRTAHIQNIMNWTCWMCEHPYWARQLLMRMDPVQFEAEMTAGKTEITAGNRTYVFYSVKLPRINYETFQAKTGPFEAYAQTQGPEHPDQVWAHWISGYRKALLRFDQKYAKRDKVNNPEGLPGLL